MDYLNVQIFSREEELELIQKAQSGCIESRNKVILSMYPIIVRESRKIAKQYRRDPEDLVQVGMQHVTQNFHCFELEKAKGKGIRASGYFIPTLTAILKNFIFNTDQLIKLPNGSHCARYGREKLQKVAHRQRRMSIDTLNKAITADNVADERKSQENETETLRIMDEFHRRLQRLDWKDQQLVKWRLEGLTLREIGHYRGGVSKEAIRQQLLRIERKLKEVMDGIL